MSSQPHKEERFMYVIYPGILVTASVILSNTPRALRFFIIFCIFLVSASRTFQVYSAYSAPMDVWRQVNGNICVGRDWYLFPSSYFLNGELKFYKDGFKGLLPGKFGAEYKMNNMNLEESDRYVEFSQCDFLIGLNVSDKVIRDEVKNWDVAVSLMYLDSKTKQPFRSFYLPSSQTVFGYYVALKNNYNE